MNFCKVEEISDAYSIQLPPLHFHGKMLEKREGRGRGEGALGGRREIVERGEGWRLQGVVATRGGKCSVVLRPTDPLDNASTGGH